MNKAKLKRKIIKLEKLVSKQRASTAKYMTYLEARIKNLEGDANEQKALNKYLSVHWALLDEIHKATVGSQGVNNETN